MDNETEIIKKYVQILPQGMKDYLVKKTWPQRLSLIAQMNKMSEDQASAMDSEVFLVLIGMEKYSDLKNNIQQNVVGLSPEIVKSVADEIEKNIFSEIKPMLVEIDEAYTDLEKENEDDLSKESVLAGIEDPTPTKPIVSNPIGKNIILDAQHNLPEQEKKILISSAAVPSRGPILGNLKTGFAPAPAIQQSPAVPPIPKTIPVPISIPIQQPIQVSKPPLTPIPPAPTKYTTDPYREPLE